MKITFLGTGTSQGVPVIGCPCAVCHSTDARDNRLRCALLIEQGEDRLVIDIGPDFRMQMLRAKVTDVDAILLTHEHNDHIVGLDDVRPFNFLNRKDMPVYGQQRVLDSVKQRFPYIFASNPYPGATRVTLHEISHHQPVRISNIDIQPIEIFHGRLPILAYRFGDIAYLTDMKTISDEEFKKLEDLDTLIVSTLRHEEHFSHFTLKEGLAFAKKVGARQTYFTHVSHMMGKFEDIEKELPEGINFAYDGLVIEGEK